MPSKPTAKPVSIFSYVKYSNIPGTADSTPKKKKAGNSRLRRAVVCLWVCGGHSGGAATTVLQIYDREASKVPPRVAQDSEKVFRPPILCCPIPQRRCCAGMRVKNRSIQQGGYY